MVLSKEDIEVAIAQSQHQDEIRHSLSNYFEDLEKPVAVAIGIGNHKTGEGRFGPEFDTGGEDRDAHPQNVDKVVNLLRKNGIDAVSFIDPKATSPDSFVVTETGVLCPFMTPNDSLKATIKIENILLDNDFKLSGHVNPLAVENILYASKNSIDSQWQAGSDSAEHILNLQSMHPNLEEFSDLEKNNGGDYKAFVERKVREAYASSTDVDLNQMDINNVYEEGMPHLYRGGTLGGNPYAVVSQFTSRKVAHSSPAISICSNFSGKGKSFSSRGGAVYEKTSDNIEYGFIYKLKSLGDEQKYYRNVGLETGRSPKTKEETNLSAETPWNGHDGDIYETPILPHHNPIESIYLYVGQWNEQKLFEIPMENGQVTDPEWRDFLKMHEPTDDKTLGYLATRQNLQKQQQTDNPLHAYEFVEKNNLEPDTQEYLNNVSAREFLSNFMHEGDIRDNADNTISVTNTDFNLNGLKLSKLPDMSGVRIEGSFNLNNSTINNIEAKNLPMVSGGISMLGIKIQNPEEISAQHFLNIIGANQQGEWSRIDIDKTCNLSLDGAPHGFEELKLYEMPAGLKVTYDTIEKIPETLKGISISGVKIKDQSSIENMQASDFIYKIKGNMGTHPLGYDIGVLQEQGVHHTQIHDNISLNLEHTNINTLPKDMKNLTVQEIIFNHETVVTSLDNFPVTKRGIYDLNFTGDLKNETMESFLLKTKGTEWVANNTTKAEDGHLVITGDFNFTTQSWSDFSKHQMEITSFPKDIEKVEFKGAVEPQKIHRQIKIYKDVMNNKETKELFLHDNEMKMDLSAHQATDINIEGSLQDIILPQTVSKIDICDCKNCQIDKLKNMPENPDLSCYRITNEQSFDMSNLSVNNLRLSQSSFSAISFPKTIKTLDIDNVELNKPIVLPEGMQEFSATATKFPKESVVNLSSCRSVILSDCTFDKNTKLDLSNCERVDLHGVDLSNVDVILPKKGRVNIGEDVKFAPDFKLDLSNCEEGYVNPNVQCQEIKLPKKIILDSLKPYKLPQGVKDISTACIRDSGCKFEIPSHVKIVDEPDKNGKKVSLKTLKFRGVSKKQISQIRKERIINSIKGLVHKIVPDKKKTGVSQTVSAPTINFSDNRLAALSGRNGASSKSVAKEEVNVVAPQTIEQAPVQQVQEPVKVEPTAPKPQQQNASLEPATTSPKTTVAEMTPKEKVSFFKSLRKGVNTLLSKVSTGKEKTTENQTTQQSKTNTQAQMLNRASDRGR